MPAFSGNVLIADDITAAVREVRDRAPKEMRKEIGLIARGAISQRLIRQLSVAPPKWRGKRRWNSERQRRAYFATNGFGKGIPYVRSGDLERGWRVVVGTGATLLVENSADYASYVQGDDQQLMHTDSGWPYAPKIINDFVDEYEDAVINGWFRVVDRLEKRAT